MNSNILLVGDGSTFEGIKLDSISLTHKQKTEYLIIPFHTVSNNANAEIEGSLDFLQENLGYKASGIVNNLDFGKLMKDTATVTDLNFKFRTEGENFDIDKMNMFLTLDLSPSTINGVKIDSTRSITDIFTDDNQDRVINFISDIADVTIKGNFSLPDAISVLSKETGLLTNAFMNKIAEMLPADKTDETLAFGKRPEKTIPKLNLKRNENVSILYLVDLKDFGIISPFLKDRRLEIDGNMSGNILYNNDSINATLNSNLNYVKYWGKT